MKVDLLIHNAAQLVTCASPDGAKRGEAMRDVGLIEGGAVAVAGGEIVAVGSSADLLADYTAREMIDASGKVVCPGFVDPHTHVVYAGDRVHEFEMRIQGASYMEIMQAGGGIVSTMRAVRQAPVEQLVAESRRRLDAMMALGTTTVEIKTGYGLSTEAEIKMLDAIAQLHATHPLDLIPTFLGAHAIPPEYKGRTDDYIDLVIEEMLPAVAKWRREAALKRQLRTIDFSAMSSAKRAYLIGSSRGGCWQQARRWEWSTKIHADEFENIGGVSLAVDLGATSADHLDVTPSIEIAQLAASDTIGVVLPAVNFHLGSAHYAPARELIDAGVALALATDINPGSAPCASMPLVMAIATRYQRLLPSEALNASTINAAHAIGLGHRVGSIEVGKQADILIVNAPDYRHLAYELGVNLVERVIKQSTVNS